MDSVSRYGDTADGRILNTVFCSCELCFSILIPEVEIEDSQTASEFIQSHVSAWNKDDAASPYVPDATCA